MYRKQMSFQRVVCLLAIIAGAVMFVYSLGIMTDLYDMLYSMIPDPEDLDYTYVDGARIYYDMQGFNQQLLSLSLGMILCACVLFLTNTQLRRKYYIGNYFATCLNVVAEIGMAIWCHIQVEAFKTQYLTTVDFETLESELSREGTFTTSTFWFDIHYLACGLCLVAAALLIVNVIWKKKMMSGEQSLLRSGKAVSA